MTPCEDHGRQVVTHWPTLKTKGHYLFMRHQDLSVICSVLKQLILISPWFYNEAAWSICDTQTEYHRLLIFNIHLLVVIFDSSSILGHSPSRMRTLMRRTAPPLALARNSLSSGVTTNARNMASQQCLPPTRRSRRGVDTDKQQQTGPNRQSSQE